MLLWCNECVIQSLFPFDPWHFILVKIRCRFFLDAQQNREEHRIFMPNELIDIGPSSLTKRKEMMIHADEQIDDSKKRRRRRRGGERARKTNDNEKKKKKMMMNGESLHRTTNESYLWWKHQTRFIATFQMNGDRFLSFTFFRVDVFDAFHRVNFRIFVSLLVMQFESIRIQFRVTNLPGESECARVLLQLSLENQIRRFLIVENVVLFELGATFLFDLIRFLIDRVENGFYKRTEIPPLNHRFGHWPVISCCHRSEITMGKFLYNSWSVSVNWRGTRWGEEEEKEENCSHFNAFGIVFVEIADIERIGRIDFAARWNQRGS